jgi:hypothetical protein
MSNDKLEEIIELIKFGIENRSWASVEEAFDCLTEDMEEFGDERIDND